MKKKTRAYRNVQNVDVFIYFVVVDVVLSDIVVFCLLVLT